jgi:hypothetical protein
MTLGPYYRQFSNDPIPFECPGRSTGQKADKMAGISKTKYENFATCVSSEQIHRFVDDDRVYSATSAPHSDVNCQKQLTLFRASDQLVRTFYGNAAASEWETSPNRAPLDAARCAHRRDFAEPTISPATTSAPLTRVRTCQKSLRIGAALSQTRRT